MEFFSCIYKVVKRQHELSQKQRKKILINRLKYAEHKIFCICIEVSKIYEDNDFNEI